jgi:hypothetical protein
MKSAKVFWVTLLSLLVTTAAALAQHATRTRPVLADRGGSSTPPQLPDPSGTYAGSVTFTVAGQQGTFTQTWYVPIKTRACSECMPGQYAFGGTDYQLVQYGDEAAPERGSVSGVINADGTAFLELRAANCTYLSFGLGGSSAYQSGTLGPAPGTKLKIANGTLTGRLSGYDCFGQLITADLSIHKQSSNVSQCSYRGGYYFGTFTNSLGQTLSGDVLIEQAGCAFSGFSPEGHAAIDAVQISSSSVNIDAYFTPPCSGTASGTGQIHSDGSITGTTTGTISGCVATQSITDSFTLVPE